jgi:translocation and assembly module TamB
VKTPDIGTGYANVIINPYQSSMPMHGEVAFNDVQLKVLKPFIQDVRSMSGTLALAGKVNGTLTQPQFTGEMRLKNGAISMISLPVNLTMYRCIHLFVRIWQQLMVHLIVDKV